MPVFSAQTDFYDHFVSRKFHSFDFTSSSLLNLLPQIFTSNECRLHLLLLFFCRSFFSYSSCLWIPCFWMKCCFFFIVNALLFFIRFVNTLDEIKFRFLFFESRAVVDVCVCVCGMITNHFKKRLTGTATRITLTHYRRKKSQRIKMLLIIKLNFE